MPQVGQMLFTALARLAKNMHRDRRSRSPIRTDLSGWSHDSILTPVLPGGFPLSPNACTVRAINKRRALPLSTFSVSISNSFTSSISSILLPLRALWATVVFNSQKSITFLLSFLTTQGKALTENLTSEQPEKRLFLTENWPIVF